MARTYFVRTFGCQMNEHDSEHIAGILEADGLQRCGSVEEADVVVLNTCTIRENADNRLYGHLGHLKSLKERRPGMQIAVGGCMAQKDKGLIQRRAPYVDAVFGTHNVARVGELLRQAEVDRAVMEVLEEAEAFPGALPVRRESAHSAWVNIQVGCDNRCAFCIVPAVRGREISRPFAEVISEVERLAAAGTVEVTLLGQNVNSYGRDLALAQRATGAEVRARPQFASLLRAVAGVPGMRRVRYTSPHPKDLLPETVEVMAEVDEVCPHLHYPLQSGSDRVLAAMHRGYTARRYLDKLAGARAAVADLAVTTDIIVGFPGETDDDFERTLEVVAEAGFDSAYTFVYSPRPGTEAAAWADSFIAPEVVAERFERLRVVVERSALTRHRARVGRVEEVMVEGPSRKDPFALTGRTAQAKLLHFRSDPLPAGTFAEVRVTAAAPHHLSGELVGVTARPRRRLRIPVASR